MFKRKKKKAQIEVQFSWIFMLIVGGIILLFFITIILKQKDLSDTKIDASLRSDMSSIITGSGVSTGTASLIEWSGKEMEYDCEGYSIGKLAPIKPYIAFSPDEIIGNELILWSLDWNVPYRAANFLFITTPAVRYIIVDDPNAELAEAVNITLPPRNVEKDELEKPFFNKEFVNEDELFGLLDQNNYKVRVIFFNKDINELNAISKYHEFLDNIDNTDAKDITAISIIGNDINGIGELNFFRKRTGMDEWVATNSEHNNNNKAYYLGKASVMAAIFTEDIDSYKCYMKNAFEHYGIVTSIYENRTNVLKDYYRLTLNNPCHTASNSTVSYLLDMKQDAEEISNKYLEGDIMGDLTNLYANEELFVKVNDQMQKLSCAEVY